MAQILLLLFCAAATAIPANSAAENWRAGRARRSVETDNLLQTVIEENRNISKAESVKKMSETLAAAMNRSRCPPPWKAFRHMCFLLVTEYKLWPEARQHCVSEGGVLTWIESKDEHQLINEFLKGKEMPTIYYHNWYHIGLHRKDLKQGNPLQWIGSSSSYRGEPMYGAIDTIFSTEKGKTVIVGNWPGIKQCFLCRRY